MERLSSIKIFTDRISFLHRIKLGLCFWEEKESSTTQLIERDVCEI